MPTSHDAVRHSVSWDKARRAERAFLETWDAHRPQRRPRYLGADEIQRGGGYRFWTVLSDLVRLGLRDGREEIPGTHGLIVTTNMDAKIPFTVIGGYLGSGKTTLLNALLRQPHGLKLAVLVNDFGSINIDAELIVNQDGETVSLTNGCICCSINDNIGETLRHMSERPVRPDQVIVEASGVAYPDKIARYGTMPGFTLQGILVVADAETVRARSRDRYVGHTVVHQLKDADLIILNKTDLVNDQQKQEVRAWLADMAPKSRIIDAQQGMVPHELLLGVDSKFEFNEHAEDNAHQHGTEFTSWSYESDVPFLRGTFETLVASLPESVVRAKGVVYLQAESERRHILHVMGNRWKLTPGIPWASEKRGSRLVFIGVRGLFDPAELSLRLEDCMKTQGRSQLHGENAESFSTFGGER